MTAEALAAATAEVVVDATPDDAFAIFTDEIGLWWRTDSPYWNDRERARSIRIEPRVGGRLIEVHDLAAGTGLEIGCVTTWEPGERLAFTWTQVAWPPDVETRVDVTFEPLEGSMAIFTAREAAEAFVAGHPFVRNGVVRAWQVREWNEVLAP